MLTLYGNLDSGNVYKVRLLWSWLGLAHRRVDVAQARGEPMSAAFRRVNPIGKVPAVRLPDRRMLSESGAILYYFADGTPFWPDDRLDRAEVLRWMFFEQYSHEPAIAVNRYLLRYAPEPLTADDPRVRANDARGRHALAVMEARLAAEDWLAAGRATIADAALYAYTHSADEAGIDLAGYPAIRRWLDRVAALPGHVGQHEEPATVAVAAFPSEEAQCDRGG